MIGSGSYAVLRSMMGVQEMGAHGRSSACGRSAYHVLIFFFQAEDGIRDYKVTGVQTCALPICRHLDDARQRGAKVLAGGEIHLTAEGARFVQPTVLADTTAEMDIVREETFGPMQIGRASCRERV